MRKSSDSGNLATTLPQELLDQMEAPKFRNRKHRNKREAHTVEPGARLNSQIGLQQ